jgi:hypothetical protein
LAADLGTDIANLGSTETVAVYFDLNKDTTFDVIAGVSADTDVTGFTVATFSGVPANPGFAFGAPLAGHIGSYYANPSAAAPDFEFTILNWSTLPGQDSSLGGFIVWAFLGSLEDNGIGEDFIQYEQNPHTIATIVSSAAKVVSGGSVTLNVSEASPILPTGNVSQTNPQVVITKNGAPLTTLTAPPTSGDNGDGILDPGENWTWTNIPGGAITGPTTFVARGSSTAPGDFAVNYNTDPLEQVEVTADAIAPNTTTTIAVSATTVMFGGSVTLNVTEANTGDDPLTSPYVELRQGATLIATLNKASGYYVSGDTSNPGVLDPGETWHWNNIPSNPITGVTTFEAKGFGTDSLGSPVTYPTYPSERATVGVSTIAPNTTTTIAISATTVMFGGSVTLNVTEANTGDDPLTSPYVELRKNGTLMATLNKASGYYASGDTSNPGVLDPGETWHWNNIPSGAITGVTTFEAKGFGTDSLGNPVTYPTYPSERATVGVSTIAPNTTTTMTVSATLIISGSSVTLNVTEANTGDDPLTSPRVELRKNGTLIATLNKASGYYASGDTSNPGVLDPGETWHWNNIPSGAITGATTFEALGFGTDSLGQEVSYAHNYLSERAVVTVNTIQPNTITHIFASAATVSPGESVSLNVTEYNNGGDPLTNPYVEVRQGYPGGTLIATLNKASPYYAGGDTSNPGVLDPGETWHWNNIPSNPINALTTFEARGFGTDSLGNEISHATGHTGERDTVNVNVSGEGCLRICKFEDANVNSVWDPGEEWLAGWSFHVTGPGGYDTWVTTGPDGCVVLNNLVSGEYTVTEELKAGWYNTLPGGDPPYEQEVTVTISADCARVEFGNREEIQKLPPNIPTLNQWGIIAMIAVFAGLLVWTVRRKRLASRMS